MSMVLDQVVAHIPAFSYIGVTGFQVVKHLSWTQRVRILIPSVALQKFWLDILSVHKNRMYIHVYIYISIYIYIYVYWEHKKLFFVVYLLNPYQAQRAVKHNDQEGIRENEKKAFAFAIFTVVAWIITLCLLTVTVYSLMCTPNGLDCNTAPH